MSLRASPLADRIIVLPCVDTKKSLIIIPQQYLDKSPKDLVKRGVVAKKGTGTKGYPMKDIHEKQVILYALGNYPKHFENDIEYDMIRYRDLIGIEE